MTSHPLAHDQTGREHPRTVLLLHAGVADRRMWDPQWQPLADAGYRLLRADLRGFGDTPAATDAVGAGGETDEADEADDVRALLDSLGIDRVTVVGASFGGLVALELAARWPARVEALVLLATARPGHTPAPALAAFDAREEELLDSGDLAAAAELNAETWLGPEATPAVRDLVRRMQHRAFVLQSTAGTDAHTDDEGGEEGGEEVSDDGGTPDGDGPGGDPAGIHAPTLTVSGAHDFPDFRQIAAELATLLPHAEHRELPWAGHLPSLERPEEITRLLLDFLATTEPDGRPTAVGDRRRR